MSPVEFSLAILALLLTPGPTNTLLAVAGSVGGWRRSLPLIAGEICGYLLVIVPLVTVAAEMLAAHPAISLSVKLCSAAWVLFLAARLWLHVPAQAAGGDVSTGRVFVTTLLNPKALIIGLVLMPHGAFLSVLPRLTIFCGLVIVVAMTWLAFGAFLGRSGTPRTPMMIRRIAAGVLLVFSASLVGKSFGLI